MKQHGLVTMKQRQGHDFIGDTVKKYIDRIKKSTKKILIGDIDVCIVFGALIGLYIGDWVFYDRYNDQIVVVGIVIALFKWMREVDENTFLF